MADDLPLNRGELTRERLVRAALSAFGRDGYDSVSIRRIAAAASANVASINYHFGGKEGLYLEVARLVGDELGARLTALGDAMETALEEAGDDRPALRRAGRHLVVGILDHVFKTGDRPDIMRFLLQEQVLPSGAFNILYDSGMGRLHVLVSRLMARLDGGHEEDPALIIRAHALIGQCLSFVVARAALCRRLGVDILDEAEISRIKDVLPSLIFGDELEESHP